MNDTEEYILDTEFIFNSGILTNLLVVTTVRYHDQLMLSTTNLLLLNLCFSNILVSFLVKPISGIYGAYSISTGRWQVSLVFCSLYTLMYTTTWCILPFSILCLSWLHILPFCFKSEHNCNTGQDSARTESPSSSNRESMRSSTPSPYYPGTLSPEPAPPSPETKRRLAQLRTNVSLKQKILLLSVWIFSAFFGLAFCFPEKIFGMEVITGATDLDQDLLEDREDMRVCMIKTGLNDILDYLSICVCLILPLLLGPTLLIIIKPFIHLQTVCDAPSPILLLGLTITFISSYSLHMIISETFFINPFTFLVLKNLGGFLYLIFVPIIIIINQKDIRKGLRPIFRSKIICPDPEADEIFSSISPSQNNINTRSNSNSISNGNLQSNSLLPNPSNGITHDRLTLSINGTNHNRTK